MITYLVATCTASSQLHTFISRLYVTLLITALRKKQFEPHYCVVQVHVAILTASSYVELFSNIYVPLLYIQQKNFQTIYSIQDITTYCIQMQVSYTLQLANYVAMWQLWPHTLQLMIIVTPTQVFNNLKSVKIMIIYNS